MNNQEKINEVLFFLAERLSRVDYAFIGSANLYLQGLDINPRDIDILTTPDGSKQIDEILNQFQTQAIRFDETGGRNSFRSFYEIKGVEIEVLGNVGNAYRDAGSLAKKIFVPFLDTKLPCISLNEELKTYEKLGRLEKVKSIKEFLLIHKQDSSK